MADPVKVRITGSPEKVVRLLVGVARETAEDFVVAPAYEEDRFVGFDVTGELRAVKRILAYRKRVAKDWQTDSKE